MGLFDYVNFEMECPKCKTKINDFQSKDEDASLKNIKVKDVNRFYSSCVKCNLWIEFERKKPKLSNKPKLKEVLKEYKLTIYELKS